MNARAARDAPVLLKKWWDERFRAFHHARSCSLTGRAVQAE
jgi:hypothetical protein